VVVEPNVTLVPGSPRIRLEFLIVAIRVHLFCSKRHITQSSHASCKLSTVRINAGLIRNGPMRRKTRPSILPYHKFPVPNWSCQANSNVRSSDCKSARVLNWDHFHPPYSPLGLLWLTSRWIWHFNWRHWAITICIQCSSAARCNSVRECGLYPRYIGPFFERILANASCGPKL